MKQDAAELFDLRIAELFASAKSGAAGRLRPLCLAEAALFQTAQAARRRAEPVGGRRIHA